MIVRGARPQSNFHILDKAISEDSRLTWAARGMLIFLLGKPDHWQVSPAALVNETKDSRVQSGRDAVWALLKELIDTGYCTRVPMRNADGTMGGMSYSIQETPHTAEPGTANPPRTGYPSTAEPGTANPTQASTDCNQGLNEARTDLSIRKKSAKTAKAEKIGFDLETGTFTNLTAMKAMDFKAAYPSVNLDAEIKRAAIWMIANPAKRPTSNFARFLASWLSKAQSRIDIAQATGAAAPVNFYEQRKNFLSDLTGGPARQNVHQLNGTVIDV